MICWNDNQRRSAMESFCRLDSLALHETDSDRWGRTIQAKAMGTVERLQTIQDKRSDEYMAAWVELYRLAYRAHVFRLPREYFLWLLVGRLGIEAYVGPDAVLNQKDYLGPLWDRLEAIRRRHGWPEEDENGEAWSPEEHLDKLPKDYAAWSAEFEAKAEAMEKAAFRAVCERHGVPEIADLAEHDRPEYERRMKIGYEHEQGLRRESRGGLPGPGHYTSSQGGANDEAAG